MDNADLKNSAEEWRDYYLKARESLIPRDVPKLPSKKFAAALIGIRRSGKTFCAIQMSLEIDPQQVFYYNFEDPLFSVGAGAKELDQLLNQAEEYSTKKIEVLVLDEIQNVENWEKWLRKKIDQQHYHIIITGSSAKLLSSELATSLSGRCLEYRIWPLSLLEVGKFSNRSSKTKIERKSLLRQVMAWGSFPEVILEEDVGVKKKILEQYLTDILFKDVMSRHEIRHKRSLDQIINYYFTNPSSLHSYSAIKNAFGINTDTVGRYTLALSDAFLMFEVERYHANLKIQSRDAKKVYLIDPGLRSVISRSPNTDSGKILEGLIYIELLRRGKTVWYFKEEREVDFVITERYKVVGAIQVCASNLSNEDTYQREVAGLLECLQKLDLEHGIIISQDREERIKRDGKVIQFIDAAKWLLASV